MRKCQSRSCAATKASEIAASIAVWCQWRPCQHHPEDVQQLLRDFEITLIAGLMECDQDLVG